MVEDTTKESVSKHMTRLFATQWRTLAAYFTTFIISIAGPIWVHRLRPADLTYPWRVKDSDLSSVYSLAQALGQSWTGLVHHSLGAPFNANLALAFIPDDLHLEILRILVHITNNPFTAVNLFYVLTYGLCGISFLFLCEQLNCNRFIGVAMSTAYAWLPYHFTRMNDGHVFLAAYYMIPFGLLVLLRLIDWLAGRSVSFLPRTKKFRFLLLLTVVAVGSSGAYYGLFFALLAASTLVLVPKKDIRVLEMLRRAAVVAGVALCFVLAPILRNFWAKTHGLETQLTRSPLESIQFGGSISRLYVPWGVWIPDSMRPITERQEFEWLAVPLLAVLGIWILTLGLVRRAVRTDLPTGSERLHGLQYLYFWSLLFFVAGGLSLVFAYGVDSSFRTWNRFAIVIMTASMAALTVVLTQFLRSKSTATVGALIVLSFGFLTQLRPIVSAGIGAEPDSVALAEFQALGKAAAVINRTIPKGCSILQLPVMAFPEGGLVDGVGNGQHLWLPLLTHGYRWSYGAPKGSIAGDFWSSRGLDPHDPIKEAEHLNFCAIVNQGASSIQGPPVEQMRRFRFGQFEVFFLSDNFAN